MDPGGGVGHMYGGSGHNYLTKGTTVYTVSTSLGGEIVYLHAQTEVLTVYTVVPLVQIIMARTSVRQAREVAGQNPLFNIERCPCLPRIYKVKVPLHIESRRVREFLCSYAHVCR